MIKRNMLHERYGEGEYKYLYCYQNDGKEED